MKKATFCDRCDICIHNNFLPLWGIGDENADIIIIHESPTKRERRLTSIYDGKKYTLLARLLYAYNFNLDNCYFTHAIKCATPKGREPSLNELRHCTVHLIEELQTVKPKIIVLLGATLLKHFYSDQAMSLYKEHGKARIIGKFVIVPTFSPSFINQNPKMLRHVVNDWELIYNYYKVLHPNHFKNI